MNIQPLLVSTKNLILHDEKKQICNREFKENSVELSYQREDIKSLAIELGVTSKLLYRWHSIYRLKDSKSSSSRENEGLKRALASSLRKI